VVIYTAGAGGSSGNNYGLGVTNNAYGGTANTWLYGTGNATFGGDVTAVSYTTTSNSKYKTNIRPISAEVGSSLDIVNALSGVVYDSVVGLSATDQIGLIAQDVYEVLPHVVTLSATDTGEEPLGIQYSRIVAVLIEAVKELNQEVKTLKQSLSGIL